MVTLILAYFGYHALHGRYGLLAWIDTQPGPRGGPPGAGAAQAPSARSCSATSQAFQRDSLDRDLLEEELRKLGYVQPNEVIILRRDEERAARPD